MGVIMEKKIPLEKPVESPYVPPTINPLKPELLVPKYDWSSRDKARHSVRVICDEEGLSVAMKNELCLTVQGESDFNPRAFNKNTDGSDDCGIAQLNTKWYLKPNNMTCEDAKNDPEKSIRIMARSFKAGRQRDWIAWRKLFEKYNT